MQEAKKKIAKAQTYAIKDAVALALETSKVKFDASVEVHFHLGIDPKKGDQQIRATVSLPHGSGKNKRVAAFVGADRADEARQAGADMVMDERGRGNAIHDAQARQGGAGAWTQGIDAQPKD